jgi:hypothetical protein
MSSLALLILLVVLCVVVCGLDERDRDDGVETVSFKRRNLRDFENGSARRRRDRASERKLHADDNEMEKPSPLEDLKEQDHGRKRRPREKETERHKKGPGDSTERSETEKAAVANEVMTEAEKRKQRGGMSGSRDRRGMGKMKGERKSHGRGPITFHGREKTPRVRQNDDDELFAKSKHLFLFAPHFGAPAYPNDTSLPLPLPPSPSPKTQEEESLLSLFTLSSSKSFHSRSPVSLASALSEEGTSHSLFSFFPVVAFRSDSVAKRIPIDWQRLQRDVVVNLYEVSIEAITFHRLLLSLSISNNHFLLLFYSLSPSPIPSFPPQ